MTSVRQVLADNVRKNRHRLGFSQAKLAEKADTSTHYIAMIELSRTFPSPEMLERIASALEIDTLDLFSVSPSPNGALETLHKAILTDIERVVGDAVEKAISEKLQERVLTTIERSVEQVIANHLKVLEKKTD